MGGTVQAVGSGMTLLVLLALVALPDHCAGFPDRFTAKHQKRSCTEHPSNLQRYGRHGRSTPDRATVIAVSLDGKPRRVLCPGVAYDVKVAFPSPRLGLLTASQGAFEPASSNTSCANVAMTPRHVPVGNFTSTLVVACAAAGRHVELKVTSAASRSSSLKFTRLVLPVDLATAPRCVEVSAECVPVRPASILEGEGASGPAGTFIPLTPSAFDLTPGGRSAGGYGSGEEAAPEYAFAPVLTTHKALWQTLHGLLMLLSFCVLMPVGTMLARHKWLFGRDNVSGRVLSSWGPVHVLCQVLGLLAAAAGVVIAILAFGWKRVPGQPLYLPHKWAGVGVMGMALIQLVLGMLRPENHTRPRGCWNALHAHWGRLTIIGGMGNAILGGLLIHDYKGDSYLFWLLPAAILVGLCGLAALTLEAFKMQMQRTYRYNHRTRNMLPVLEGFKRSKRRAGSSGGGSGGGNGSGLTASDLHGRMGGGPPMRDNSDDEDCDSAFAPRIGRLSSLKGAGLWGAGDTYCAHDQDGDDSSLYPKIVHRGSPVKPPRHSPSKPPQKYSSSISPPPPRM